MITLKGQSLTGMVHWARQVKHLDKSVKTPMLSQTCGMGRSQRAYLSATDAPVTCKRCLALQPNPAAPVTVPTEVKDFDDFAQQYDAKRTMSEAELGEHNQALASAPEKSASQKAKATRLANQRAAKPETPAQTIKRSRVRNADIREREAAQDAKRAAKVTEPPRSSVSPGTPAKGEKVIGAKAERLADAARALGWQTAVSIVGNLGAMMVAARDQETVTLTWDDEVVKVKGWHEFPGGRKAVYNAKEATRAMGQATPVVVQRQPSRRAQAAGNGQSTDASARVTALVRSLPFDPATATDAEVLAHLAPTSVVTWVNSVSGLTESAVVYCRRKDNAKDTSLPLRSLRMENGEAGRRIVTFPTEDSGLRSVALEKLVSVR